MLNCIDHYQATPSSFDPPLFGRHGSTQQKEAPTLPVIRVFGATETGQKVCAHIHGALPYLFIGYDGSLEQDDLGAYIHQLRISIDHALAVSYRRNVYDGKARFVAHITLVKAVPFFGYHVGHRHFLKIYMLNPINMTRFADLLYQGAIMKQTFQPYEAHLQYLLQWMCDFNLYGCAYIECAQFKFRDPIPSASNIDTRHYWHDRSIDQSFISPADEFPRQSHCSLEVDICVQDIVNRFEVQARDLHADFAEHFQPANPEEKLVRSLAGLWMDESKRRKRRMGLTDNSSSPFPPEVLVSMSADSRNTNKGGWIHEDEYRSKVDELAVDEMIALDKDIGHFDDFVQAKDGTHSVQTAQQSIEDLFRENLLFQQDERDEQSFSEQQNFASTQALVDEMSIPNFEQDEFPNAADDTDVEALFAPQDVGETVKKDELYDSAEKDGSQLPKISDMNGRGNNSHVSRNEHEGGDLEKRAATNMASENRHQKVRQHRHAQTEFDDWDEAQGPPRKRMKLQDASTASAFDEDDPRERTDKEASTASSSQTKSQTLITATGREKNKVQGFPVSKSISSQDHVPEAASAARKNVYEVSTKLLDTSKGTEHSEVLKDTSPNAAPSQPLVSALAHGFDYTTTNPTKAVIAFHRAAPAAKSVEQNLRDANALTVLYRDAYYSMDMDVPERARDYAGREFRLAGCTTPYLPPFDPVKAISVLIEPDPPPLDAEAQENTFQGLRPRCRLRNWQLNSQAPSYGEVSTWLQERAHQYDACAILPSSKNTSIPPKSPFKQRRGMQSQIEGPTQKHAHGFKFSQKRESTSVKHETQYMSTMSLEVHVNTRQAFVPNPEEDEVACIFWSIKCDGDSNDESVDGFITGILLLADSPEKARQVSLESAVEVEWWPNELDLLNRTVDIVREHDPDILTGYEVHNGSWGYLIERARIKYEFDLCDEFSRMLSHSHGRFGKAADRWGFNTTSTIRVTGRHMINVWRAMRSELNLLQYTMENVVFHLLHKRIPHYPFPDLTAFFSSDKTRDVSKCLRYFLERTRMNLEILEANELVARTSEQARLIGVDFFSVFSRGSQFKVESFMFRIAKPENYLLVSPSRKQVGQQNALECLPLVMEPQSAFYPSPLLVLDFQSLYPSIMIAYNYCYSTCLGRVVSWRGRNKMGFADFQRQPGLLQLVKDSINIAPNGMMYVKPEMRKSLLAKMLGEILETRFMVKSGMKADKDDRTLQQLLNNRQLALKLLANVTYGYTSASFSGRMPCSEIADSIVQTGRETLEKAIALIHSVERWGAEVVYGDTDSLFVYLKGRTREQAFDIGNEIAAAITKTNPRPIKLKFEKVYHPCVLLAKKRYVGFKYESKDQVEPEFDAKGIETIRRDGTAAEQKIEEKALKILFRTSDLSQVKSYFLRQCAKIMTGNISIQDFCYAREVKLGTYADKGPPPPGALISTKRMLEDARTEPQYGERIPYVVITGAPSARLIDRCVAPETLLKDEGAELDAEYYISKNLIPPLERIFNLVGANVRQWYDEMPKVHRIRDVNNQQNQQPQYAPNGALVQPAKTLEGYLHTSHCVVCRTKLPQRVPASDRAILPVCEACLAEPASSLYTMQMRLHEAQGSQEAVHKVCRSCSGLAWGEEVRCDSKDCPVFYSRVRADRKRRRCETVVETAEDALRQDAERRGEEGLDW
ncbi:MAG: hypothetical protein Q9159_003337 [Coniocarpon cinnabarinum]